MEIVNINIQTQPLIIIMKPLQNQITDSERDFLISKTRF